MSGSTLIIEFHRWRGLSRDGGPLGAILVLGFVSITYVPFLLSEWLRAKVDGMRNALLQRKFPEMDCFGEFENPARPPGFKRVLVDRKK